MHADSILQQDRLFSTMTVATDQSALDHIIEAQILIDLGEYDKSITYLNIISQRYKGNNKAVQARLLGGLARNYLKLGLNLKAIQYWEEAIKSSEGANDSLYLKAVFLNNMSLAYINLGETDKARENLLQSIKEYPLIQSYQKLSDLVLDENKDFEKSNYYLSTGLKHINDSAFKFRPFVNETYIIELNLAYITEGYAYHYHVKNDLKTALEKYQEVLSIAENLKRVNLRIEILKKIGQLYKEMQDSEKSTQYFAEYIRLNDSLRIIMNNSLSIPVESFIKDNDEETAIQDKGNTRYLILTLVFISVFLFFMISVYLKKKKKIEMTKILKDHNNISNSNKNDRVDLNLSQKTEEELMLKLEEFEATNQFLDKDMSFSSLVSFLNTNEKYLRQVLKCNKHTDYNTYINELRIKYIVNKLKTDPVYLDYKISYLADESGFSSHSKFSSDFKQIVGQTPSEFINGIKK